MRFRREEEQGRRGRRGDVMLGGDWGDITAVRKYGCGRGGERGR